MDSSVRRYEQLQVLKQPTSSISNAGCRARTPININASRCWLRSLEFESQSDVPLCQFSGDQSRTKECHTLGHTRRLSVPTSRADTSTRHRAFVIHVFVVNSGTAAWVHRRSIALTRRRAACRNAERSFDSLLVESTGISEPLPAGEARLGRRTALTFPLLPPPQKNRHHQTRAPKRPLRAASRASPSPLQFGDRLASNRSRHLPRCRARALRRSR